MAFVKQEVNPGDIMDPKWGNHIQTQYEEMVKFIAGAEIAEEGTNANGGYIRFGNGIQVCWFSETAYKTVESGGDLVEDLVFPAPFSDSNVVVIPSVDSSSIATSNYWYVDHRTTQRFTFNFHNRSGFARAIARMYLAIGKWK